jgi:hypothetical protein
MLGRLAIRRPHARSADHFLTCSSRLAQRFPDLDVALLGDAAFIVDRSSGLMSPRRQAKMQPNRSRSRKALEVIDADFKRKGRNGTDTWNRHQTPTSRIMLNCPKGHPV